MITVEEARKLGAVHTVHPGVLSLYLAVPLDRAGLRDLPARADDLIAAAESAVGGHVAEEDRSRVLERLQINGSVWPGHTVAMFAPHPGLAVLGIRPHIRPLLATVQQRPAFWVTVMRPGGLSATGPRAGLAAVNAGAVETLIVPDSGLVPGYE